MISSKKLKKLASEVALDYNNPFKNYELAREYEKLEQGAAAASFYLRAADFCEGKTFEEKWLQYKCLIRKAVIFTKEGDRNFTVEGLLQSALKVLPTRPEAYYFLCAHYEHRNGAGEWRNCLIYSTIGLNYIDADHIDDDLEYPGAIGLKYHHAAAVWKNAGEDEGKRLFFDLGYKQPIPQEFSEIVHGWLSNIGYPLRIPYEAKDKNLYKFTFDGMEDIEQNYSRYFQDMFVLAATDGKKDGIFIELGCGDPYEHNNTALLEEKFGWRGFSIDNSKRHCYNFSISRKSNITLADAGQIDYNQFFLQNCIEPYVDFLRFNAEDGTLPALEKMPFDKYDFGVIQVQHNECWWGPEVKEKSREILSKRGYVLVASDIGLDRNASYEDWWLHPQIAKRKRNMVSDKTKVNFAWDYMTKG